MIEGKFGESEGAKRSWSDSGAQSHSITAPSSSATFTATFTTQYQLTTAVNPPGGGSISPATLWLNSGAVQAVSATANSGFTFSGFSGAFTGATTPQSVTMFGPAAVTANFTGGGGGGNLVTYYSYDLLNHLTQVTMPRSTGTQTWTFVYGGDYLTGAKNPENGVVVYTYNQDGTLATKIDTKSQKTVYTCDGAKRVTQIRRYTGAFQPLRVKAARNTDYINLVSVIPRVRRAAA